ncbi:MAG: Fic family protein, partial [Methylophilaceae bacterium]|nr:Fic family protein [Methylophilaceae bacterium]
QVNLERGRLFGAMQTLGFKVAEDASLKVLTNEVVKSSEIEGEILNPEAVRSSIARRLGIEAGGLVPSSKHVDAVVEMVLDATRHYNSPLTEQRLFAWHAALFPTGYSGMYKLTVAAYRDDASGAMQVVSGGIGHEKVHYEAPPASVLRAEMTKFLTWFDDELALDPVIKAGLAHLWFLTLHPFDDGNGRIGRAVCDMALARADGLPQRFYSLSAQMQRERNDYYTSLEQAQKGTLDVTQWLTWFLGCLHRAVQAANEELKGVVYLANLSQRMPSGQLNERQMKMLNMLLHGFNGNLTTGKWAKIAQCSTDTALRDVNELVEWGVLQKAGVSKRATHYVLGKL